MSERFSVTGVVQRRAVCMHVASELESTGITMLSQCMAMSVEESFELGKRSVPMRYLVFFGLVHLCIRLRISIGLKHRVPSEVRRTSSRDDDTWCATIKNYGIFSRPRRKTENALSIPATQEEVQYRRSNPKSTM